MSAGFDCKLLPGEPILLTSFLEDFNVRTEAPVLIRQMTEIFDSASEPVFMLDDLTNLKMSFSDLVVGLALATRGETAALRHPNVRRLVVVTENEIIRFGSNALKQSQYGVSNVDVYRTLDEALEAIRAEIAAPQGITV